MRNKLLWVQSILVNTTTCVICLCFNRHILGVEVSPIVNHVLNHSYTLYTLYTQMIREPRIPPSVIWHILMMIVCISRMRTSDQENAIHHLEKSFHSLKNSYIITKLLNSHIKRLPLKPIPYPLTHENAVAYITRITWYSNNLPTMPKDSFCGYLIIPPGQAQDDPVSGLRTPVSTIAIESFMKSWRAGFNVGFFTNTGFGVYTDRWLKKGSLVSGFIEPNIELIGYNILIDKEYQIYGITLGMTGLVNWGCGKCRNLKLNTGNRGNTTEEANILCNWRLTRNVNAWQEVLTSYGRSFDKFDCAECGLVS